MSAHLSEIDFVIMYVQRSYHDMKIKTEAAIHCSLFVFINLSMLFSEHELVF